MANAYERYHVSVFNFASWMRSLVILIVCLRADFSYAQSTSVAVPGTELQTEDFKQRRTVENSKISFLAGLIAQHIEDKQSRKDVGGAQIFIGGERKFTPYLSGFLSFYTFFYDGSVTSYYANVPDSSTVMIIDRATLVITPTPFFDVELGFLGRSFPTMPASFRKNGFMGVAENVNFGDKHHGFWGAINSSQILLSSPGDQNLPEKTGAPHLMLFGGEIGFKQHNISSEFSVQKFKFENLNSAIASANPSFEANTVTGLAPAARFIFRYEGYMASFKIDLATDKQNSFGLRFGYVFNEQAINGRSEGVSAMLGINSLIDSHFVIKNEVGVFYNERDAIPAFYVPSAVGGVNRRSYSFLSKVEMPEHNIALYGRFVFAPEIENLPYMADRTSFGIGFEAKYDLL